MRMRELMSIIEGAGESTRPALLYHGTTPRKAYSIIATGLRPRGANNTFGKSVSFSDKAVGTRYYDKGAVLVYQFKPDARVISMSDYQQHGRGNADAVVGGADGPYRDREIAVFNPESVQFVGWYNKQTKGIDQEEPAYPKGFLHNWNDDADSL